MTLSRRSFLQIAGTAMAAPAFARFAFDDSNQSALCRKLAADPLRPQYHLLPAHNWMNDPNGPIFFKGRYHMFHQYNPQSAVWGNMNWAHATSPDMIHWKHEPIAIPPTPGGADQDGVFSGSAVLDNGRPTVIYTAVAPPNSDSETTLNDGHHKWRETQCLAVAQDDGLRTWKKFPQPVIAKPPEGLKVTGFRDPVMWREGSEWMLILGSGTIEKGGMVLLYSSRDLRNWTYLHPLVEGSPSRKDAANQVDTGDMWECPDFFPLGKRHVLLISTMGKVRWKVGTYANRRFTPEKEGVVDWGSYYAAKTMLDRNGTRILWGWISETRKDADLTAAGWAGAMSLPRVMSLTAENDLRTEVASPAKQLRGAHAGFTLQVAPAAKQKVLDDLRIHDLAAEIDLHLQPRGDNFAIHLQSEDGNDFATISCTSTSAGRELRVNDVKAPISGAVSSAVHLHMFLDGSVLELFSGATSLTVRIYRIPNGPLRVNVEGDVNLKTLDVWQINPISKDRLTGSMCS